MRLSLWVGLLASACGGPQDDPQPALEDRDGDGWYGIEGGGDDCNDDDDRIFPHAPEPCDGVDELAVDIGDYHPDADGDGYGDASEAGIASCEPPFAGYVDDARDCNDNDPMVNPTGIEVCDGNDNDCDGLWNEADPDVVADLVTQYTDVDGDGYGLPGSEVDLCWETIGYAQRGGDCDDADALINPGELEICNSVDDDCDGDTDDDDSILSGAARWYVDADGDGYGTGASISACTAPAGRVGNNEDCNDLDDAISPSATEECDLVDNDCDGNVDLDSIDGTAYWVDSDGDDYGRDGTDHTFCSDPGGNWVLVGGDCDDTDDHVNPDAAEQCNHVDDDCDGLDDSVDPDAPADETFWLDADGDRHGDVNEPITACLRPTGYDDDDDDCDDTNAAVWAYVTSYPDTDGDGYGDPSDPSMLCSAVSGFVLDDTDCDDDDASIHPGAAETWYDGVDGNCDGGNDYDRDHDGFVEATEGGDDCDDLESMVHPYAYEDESDGIDNDCDGDADTADGDPRTTLTMEDDDSQSISFSSVTFPFCDADYTSIWVGSNGFLTLDEDLDHSESVIEFLEAPRISAFWTDLDPESAGTVEWIEYDDAVGVYFRGVEVYASGGSTVDFAIILLEDGRVVLDYGEMGTDEAIVGWSCGPGDGVFNPAALWPETDLDAWTYAMPWDSLGIGMGTELAFYQSYSGGVADGFDTAERSVVYCMNSGTDGDGDGWTDDCGDPDDGDASVTP